jgi:hypothetical protein
MQRSLLTLALLAGFACGDKDDTGATCVEDVEDLTVTVSSHIPTVATVSWTTAEPTTSYVVFGPGEDFAYATAVETEPSTEHEHILLGVPANTDASLRIVMVDGDSECQTEAETYTTGGLAAELPGLTVTGSGMDSFMVVPVLGSPVGVVIIDPDGNIVWWHIEEDRGLDVYRADLSVDGQSVLYNAASVSGDPSEDSQIMRVSLDGSTVEGIDLPLLAHEFVEHADGTIAAMVVEYSDDGEGGEVKGNAIVEIAPDGTQTQVWSALDCFDPTVDIGDDQEYGWTFANALDWDGSYYYQSLRNFSSVVQIDPSDGSCGWVFGDVGATIQTSSAADRFKHSHQFEILEDSFLIFDNDGAIATESRVMEYSFDPSSDTATKIWEYTADPSVYSFVLGDVHRFDDGDTLVTWSVNGLIERVEGDAPIWSVATDFGTAFGFNTVRGDLYAADDHL